MHILCMDIYGNLHQKQCKQYNIFLFKRHNIIDDTFIDHVEIVYLLCLSPFLGPLIFYFGNVDVRNVLVAVSDMCFSCCLGDNLCFKSLLGLSASA